MERIAINTLMQGISAHIIKVAMLNLHRKMKERNLKSKMLLQIYDELIFEIPEEEIEKMKLLVTEFMPKTFELCVPVKIDIKLGRNWGEMA